MRIKLHLQAANPILLPIHYNYFLQGLIYRHLSPTLAKFLHQQGYQYGKRHFKLFTFSRVFGKFHMDKTKKKITFFPPLFFYISSPIIQIMEDFTKTLLTTPEVTLCQQKLFLERVEVTSPPKFNRACHIKMLAPITVYSTLISNDGKHKTYYYHPTEPEFSRQIRENLLKKYQVFHKQSPSHDFLIVPKKVDKRNQVITYFKDTLIKGWTGEYQLKGHPALLAFAYDVGLGAKNSEGFGIFEVVK